MRRLAEQQERERLAPAEAGASTESCADKLSPQEAKSARTRRLIFDAAVRCLDEIGYGETSVLKVQSLAGVSRGALTHQYPTKEDMVVGVALQLLDAVRHTPSPQARPRPEGEDGYVEWLFMFAWDRFVHTREGRALMEILIAMRTDAQLNARLAGPLAEWDASISAWFLRRLTSPAGDEEVKKLVRLFRAFGRGVTLGGDCGDDENPEELVRAMARLLAPTLRRRSEGEARSRRPENGEAKK